LDNFAQVLRPGGLLVIQILNYDGMRDANDRFEPPRTVAREGKEYLLFKFFDLKRRGATLNLAIFSRKPGEGWSMRIDANPLYAPGAAEVKGLVRGAGFEKLRLYGNHKCEDYRRDSGQLIVTAVKSERRKCLHQR